MLNIDSDIHSLSDFKRNTHEFLRQLKESGRPVVLTINGKAELVVQDTASYQKLLDLAERAERMDALRASRSTTCGPVGSARPGTCWPRYIPYKSGISSGLLARCIRP